MSHCIIFSEKKLCSFWCFKNFTHKWGNCVIVRSRILCQVLSWIRKKVNWECSERIKRNERKMLKKRKNYFTFKTHTFNNFCVFLKQLFFCIWSISRLFLKRKNKNHSSYRSECFWNIWRWKGSPLAEQSFMEATSKKKCYRGELVRK